MIFVPGAGHYLFISVRPARPGIYMIERRIRDLKSNLSLFAFRARPAKTSQRVSFIPDEG